MGIEKPINKMKKGKDGAYKHWRILKLKAFEFVGKIISNIEMAHRNKLHLASH